MVDQGVKLSCRQFKGGNLLRVSGMIDETFTPSEFVRLAGHGAVVVDLDDVRRITSFGVREWIRALHELNPTYLGLVNCRPAIVAQLNTVRGFDGPGDVITVFAPYLCPACDEEHEELLDLRDGSAAIRAGELPEVICSRCGATAEFDDVPTTYFAFTRSKPEPSPPLEIQRILAAVSGRRLSEPLSIRKEVRATVTAIWLSGVLDDRARLRRVLDGLEGDVVLSLDGLVRWTDAGLARLEQALAHVEVPVFLAHIAPDLAVRLAQSEPTAGWRLASMLVPGRCRACRNEVELDIGPDELAAEAPEGFVCRCCGSTEPPDLDQEVMSVARARLDPALPQPIRAYLREMFAAATTTVTPGALGFEDRYEVIERVGGGGMAEVSLARQRGEDGFSKLVVIKQLRDEFARDPSAVEMFVREARLAARILHPNIAQIYNLGRRDGRHFIAMEYVEGWDLRALMAMHKGLSRSFPLDHALRIASAVAAGLHAAHTTGSESGLQTVIHCDVSARNILVSRDGAIKLTDFGIARVLRPQPRPREGSSPETVWGTPGYMAPEQMYPGLGPLTPRTDIYSLGAVLFELLTGGRPAPCPQVSELSRWLDEPPPSLDPVRPGLPPLLAGIVARALARRPERRYERASDMQSDLDLALEHVGATPGAAEFSQWLQDTADEWKESISIETTDRQHFDPNDVSEVVPQTHERRPSSSRTSNSQLEQRVASAIERLQRVRRRNED